MADQMLREMHFIHRCFWPLVVNRNSWNSTGTFEFIVVLILRKIGKNYVDVLQCNISLIEYDCIICQQRILNHNIESNLKHEHIENILFFWITIFL